MITPPALGAKGAAYDVFISHASEDKESVVRDLANALAAQDLRVWYDEFTLHIGDSLRQKIDRGLGACPSNGALRGKRRGQRRFEIQMVNFEKFHAAKRHQARLLGEPNPALGS